jgi:hypothetical protein
MQGEELGYCAQKPQEDIMQSSCVLDLELDSGSGSYFLGSSDPDPTLSELTSFKGTKKVFSKIFYAFRPVIRK